MPRKTLGAIVGSLVVLSALLAGCAPETTVETVEVEVTVEVPVTVEVEKEVVVTATPEPATGPAEGKVTSFADVPDDVLAEVCEDVKAAVTYDIDARTLTLNLAAPFAPLLTLLSQGWTSPLDMEWMIGHGGWNGDCSTWLQYHAPAVEDSLIYDVENGTGPFKLERWEPGKEVVLVRSDNYWRTEPMWEDGPSGLPFFERAIYKVFDDWGTGVAAFQAGDLDHIFVPRQYAEQIASLVAEECDYITGECTTVDSKGKLRVFKGLPSTSVTDFIFAMDIPKESIFIGSGELDGAGIPPDFMSDVNIRKAFAACFDYEAYIEQAGEALPRNGPILWGMPGHDPEDPPSSTLDLAACEEYFKMADVDRDGIPAGDDEDDVWEAGFYMMLAYNTGNDQRRVMAEKLKENVESVNQRFHIDVLALPWLTYLEQQQAGCIPLYQVRTVEDYHHPHNWVQSYLSTSGHYGRTLNLPQDVQAEFDRMIAQAKGLSDPAEQYQAYKAIQRMAAEYQTSLWGVQEATSHYEQLWVQGFFHNPTFPCEFVYGLSETEDSPDARTFIEGATVDPETLDPAYMYDPASRCMVTRLYDPLVHVKREHPDEFVGQLADSWEISDDGLTYTFHIRDGVKFHEGGDLDAHDAAYAIWRGLLQDRPDGPQWMLWEALFGYASVEEYAIDKANAALGF